MFWASYLLSTSLIIIISFGPCWSIGHLQELSVNLDSGPVSLVVSTSNPLSLFCLQQQAAIRYHYYFQHSLSQLFCTLSKPPLSQSRRRSGDNNQWFCFVGWLLIVPATCECISGTDLHRQFYVLPHWDRSCRSNFPSHPVTVYWHRADQSQCWPYNARRLAG